MSALQFRAEMRINGVNPYVFVSAAKAAKLKQGWRKPMPVTVQINGKPLEPWHINMMPDGNGNFYLYLDGTVRNASATQVGDSVDVAVQFDDGYQPGPEPLPGFFAEALVGNEAAEANWNALSPSRQKEVVRSLNRLKSAEAQQRNLNQLMYVLSGNQGRFMGRTWNDGA